MERKVDARSTLVAAKPTALSVRHACPEPHAPRALHQMHAPRRLDPYTELRANGCLMKILVALATHVLLKHRRGLYEGKKEVTNISNVRVPKKLLN